MSFQAKALAAVTYTAAVVQSLAVRGAKYYAANEEEILAALAEGTQKVLAALAVAYRATRAAGVATYEAGVAARDAYEVVRPEVDAQALLLTEKVSNAYDTLSARLRNRG